MNCADNKDGTCTVDYVPVEEGDYDIAIKFDDDHIPGSPFQVPVTTKDGKPKVDPRKVRAYGPGLEPENIFPGKPTSFVVDASDTGKFLSYTLGIMISQLKSFARISFCRLRFLKFNSGYVVKMSEHRSCKL